MNTATLLFSWYNLPYLAALGAGLLLALLQLASGFGEGDADADAEVDVDVDVDTNIDMDADAELEIDGEPDIDAPDDALPEGGGPLAALGIGRIPLMLVLMALLGSLGAVGLLTSTIVAALANGYPSLAFVPVLLGSLVVALPLTRLISGGLARLAPRTSTAVGNNDLVGRAGTVISPSVSQTYGRVSVRDSHGTLHTVFAVIERGEPLPERSEVAVLAYDANQRRFLVRPLRR